MKRRQELAEEAERQRIKEEQEAKAVSEAAEQAKREAERRDDVDVGASHDDSGKHCPNSTPPRLTPPLATVMSPPKPNSNKANSPCL